MHSTQKQRKHILSYPVGIAHFGLVVLTTCLILSHTALAATDPSCNKANPTDASLSKCLKTNPIVADLNNIVNFLSAGVGIVVVGVIIFGGIQYMAAGDNPQAVTAAKKRIANAFIALLAFIFMFAFLQWLIPGGVFN